MGERILSLDPGGSTGWALYYDSLQGAWNFGVIDDRDHHLTLWNLLHKTAPTLVLCEEFIYQRRELDKGVSLVLVSCEYIGIAKLYCDLKGVPFRLARLSEMKFWGDDKLKKLGVYSSSVHSRDATRHLLWHLAFQKGERSWVEALRP
jgi:hypothetical protein